MRDIYKDETVVVPAGVTLAIKSRVITVEGPRGKLVKAIKHINMDLRLLPAKSEGRDTIVKLAVWHGARKHVACLRTVKSLIENMITGVTKGFRYKIKAVYAHFPINVIVNDAGKSVEIRNFLGEKLARQVPMLEGVTISEAKGQKDEYWLEGNDIEMVSQSAADMHIACLVRNKDIRKFLDGLYVSDKGNVVQDE
ncbi:60S ribosomal protein L9 [Cystobasidium minutum MCA 4210]|uniref:60S ribosomal protein uL6 n=1 Tax=Cystobasidium minutum MCA 4210 TaxID=1397322 RepID=UPI0034CF1B86|eukprot:jgi/Rhomi1/164809/fgenesh1_kg.1_\